MFSLSQLWSFLKKFSRRFPVLLHHEDNHAAVTKSVYFRGYTAGNILHKCQKIKCLRANHRTAPSSTAFTQHLGSHDLVRCINEDSTDDFEAGIRLVNILQLPLCLAVRSYGLIVAVGSHVIGIITNNLLGVQISIIVQGLVDDATVLREDAVGVCMAAVIVDRVEDIISKIQRPR